MGALAREVIEARIEADPARLTDVKPRGPDCGRALMGLRAEATHRQTLFRPIRFKRLYGLPFTSAHIESEIKQTNRRVKSSEKQWLLLHAARRRNAGAAVSGDL